MFPSKLQLGKGMFTLTFVDLENEIKYFYFGIRNDESIKIIFLPAFQLVTLLNSQYRNETRVLMNSDTLICI